MSNRPGRKISRRTPRRPPPRRPEGASLDKRVLQAIGAFVVVGIAVTLLAILTSDNSNGDTLDSADQTSYSTWWVSIPAASRAAFFSAHTSAGTEIAR